MSKNDVGDALLEAIGNAVRSKRQDLGLSQKALADRSNLHPTYVSELERGTRNLSVKALNQVAEALNLTFGQLATLAESGVQSLVKPLLILLIEDNRADVRLIQQALVRKNPSPVFQVVSDGAAALQYLRRKGDYKRAAIPDLVILDLNLPKKSGREVLSEMKKDESLRKIPVVVFSTSHARDDVQRSYDLNANCFITKPVDVDEFFKTVGTMHDYWFKTVKLPQIAI